MKNIAFSVFLLSALLLSACGSPTSTPVTDNELQGTSWVLQSIDGNDQVGEVIGGQAVTLTFASDTQVDGSGGCNGFGGDYRSDVRTTTVSFTNIVSTLMACQAEGVGEIESQYFSALAAATDYELSGDTLTITGGGYILVFVRA
jgi:heat shock protein HslJ